MNRSNNDNIVPKTEEAPQSLGGALLAHLRVSIVATVVLTIIVSGFYPAVVWGLAQALFHHQANGSLLKKDGSATDKDEEAVGSAYLGQSFSDPGYFHPRPSNAGSNGYDATASGGSNYGPTSARLINGATKKDDKGNEVVDFDGIHDRVVHYCLDNSIAFDSSVPFKQFTDAQGNPDDVKLIKGFNADTPLVITPKEPIPADAVTMSASGLDPEISPANAALQARRVAAARNVSLEKVSALIAEFTDGPDLGILGDPRVNVLKLNLALDAKYPAPPAPATQPATQASTQPDTAPSASPSTAPAAAPGK
jgi:K+-transporting ATPase ATPase C chain